LTYHVSGRKLNPYTLTHTHFCQRRSKAVIRRPIHISAAVSIKIRPSLDDIYKVLVSMCLSAYFHCCPARYWYVSLPGKCRVYCFCVFIISRYQRRLFLPFCTSCHCYCVIACIVQFVVNK